MIKSNKVKNVLIRTDQNPSRVALSRYRLPMKSIHTHDRRKLTGGKGILKCFNQPHKVNRIRTDQIFQLVTAPPSTEPSNIPE